MVTLALSGLLASCAAVEPVSVAREGVVVPGDWTPPDATLAISNPQYVEVVDPPPVLPLGSCASSCPDDIWGGLCTHPACTRAHPGTAELDAYIRGRWTYVRAGGTYSCRRNSNPASCENLSVHSIGRAIDLMITEIGGDADNTAGDAVANWLIENAEYIGIQRVIWDGRYWNGSRRGAHFSDISDRMCGSRYCTDHHTNHIHVELSVDGAARRTRFFTEGAPPTTCPVVCYGTAAVRADCSYVDCAATGEVCLPDPVRCGAGAPPEPATASMNASAPRPTITALGGLGRVRPTTPTRLFDTRTVEGSAALALSDGATSGPLGSMRSGALAASPSFPSDAIGAVLNVAAVPVDVAGVMTVFPSGPQPGISTVNYAPPRVRANATLVSLATGGVTFAATADVHVVADSSAVLVPGAGLGLRTAGPLRVLDTRALDTPLVRGEPFAVSVGAPADARGVVASVAVIQSGTEAGFVTAFPCGTPTPSTSSINFIGASVTANTVISELGDGSVCFVSTHPVHLVVDVTGYLVPDGELSYQAVAPVRLLDSRNDTSPWVGRLGAGQVIELPIQSLAGVPADVRAVTVNLTTVSPGSRGFVTAYPCGISPPRTSSLNFDSDNAAGALSISAIGSGSLCLVANQRTYLIVDLLGVWVPTPDAPPPTDGPGPMPDEPENPDPPMPDVDGGISAPDDAGAASDADLVALDPRGADVGASGRLSGSCSCRAPGHATRTPAAGWLALALASLARMRGRRRSTGRTP
jgi:hypothetical protein